MEKYRRFTVDSLSIDRLNAEIDSKDSVISVQQGYINDLRGMNTKMNSSIVYSFSKGVGVGIIIAICVWYFIR